MPVQHSRYRHPEVWFLLNCTPHYWDSETGENDSFSGKGHTNQVSRMTVDESGQLVSCSMDDTVRYTNLTLRDYRYVLSNEASHDSREAQKEPQVPITFQVKGFMSALSVCF